MVPPGAANDFDAVDVFHAGVLHFPVGAGEKRGVNSTAIYQDENGAREAAAEAADAD